MNYVYFDVEKIFDEVPYSQQLLWKETYRDTDGESPRVGERPLEKMTVQDKMLYWREVTSGVLQSLLLVPIVIVFAMWDWRGGWNIVPLSNDIKVITKVKDENTIMPLEDLDSLC